jgi:hypothetical protein
MRGVSRLSLSPGTMRLAGDTEPLFFGGSSRPNKNTV